MTKSQIEKFAVGYPYPTDWVEDVLKECNYDKVKADNILQSKYKTMTAVVSTRNDMYKTSELDLNMTVKALLENELGILLLQSDSADVDMYSLLADKCTFRNRQGRET